MKRQARLPAQRVHIYARTPLLPERSAESAKRRVRVSSTSPRRTLRQWSRSPRSERLVQQRGNGGAIGVADRTAGFTLALESDQRRLHAGVEGFHGILLAVEIDDEVDEVFELGVGHQLAQDRSLLGADRTPGSMNSDENRLPGLLRRCKCIRSKGLGFGCERGRGQGGACNKSGEQRGAS